MQLSSIVKAGSLFFNVIRDEKVRELVKITSNGVRRRGLLTPEPPPMPTEHRIPFSPAHYQPRHWR